MVQEPGQAPFTPSGSPGWDGAARLPKKCCSSRPSLFARVPAASPAGARLRQPKAETRSGPCSPDRAAAGAGSSIGGQECSTSDRPRSRSRVEPCNRRNFSRLVGARSPPPERTNVPRIGRRVETRPLRSVRRGFPASSTIGTSGVNRYPSRTSLSLGTSAFPVPGASRGRRVGEWNLCWQDGCRSPLRRHEEGPVGPSGRSGPGAKARDLGPPARRELSLRWNPSRGRRQLRRTLQTRTLAAAFPRLDVRSATNRAREDRVRRRFPSAGGPAVDRRR